MNNRINSFSNNIKLLIGYHNEEKSNSVFATIQESKNNKF